MRATSAIRGLIAATALLLALPAIASAATRYASTTGDASNPACPAGDPCDIQTAVEGAIGVGDNVIVNPGTYNIGNDQLQPDFGLTTIEGAPGQPIPTIVSTGGAPDPQATVLMFEPVTLRRLKIEASDTSSGFALNFQNGGTGEQLQVTATGTLFGAVLMHSAVTLRDSTAWSQSDFGGAITLGGAGASTLRNVTAIATGTSSTAVGLAENSCVNQGTATPVNCTAVIDNTIARGTAAGLLVDDDGSADGDNIGFTVTNSNYSSLDDDLPEGDIQLLGTNQTAAPLFAGAAGGDFRQLPGSPTLNAGVSAGLGSLDFEGQPRVQGPAVDIGADEAVDPASLLDLSGTGGRLKRTRTINIPAACPLVSCSVAAAANLVVKGTAAPATKSRVIKLPNVTKTLIAGQPSTLTFRLSKKNFKRLRRAKRAKLNVAATAVDSLGFTGQESIGLKFKKAKK